MYLWNILCFVFALRMAFSKVFNINSTYSFYFSCLWRMFNMPQFSQRPFEWRIGNCHVPGQMSEQHDHTPNMANLRGTIYILYYLWYMYYLFIVYICIYIYIYIYIYTHTHDILYLKDRNLQDWNAPCCFRVKLGIGFFFDVMSLIATSLVNYANCFFWVSLKKFRVVYSTLHCNIFSDFLNKFRAVYNRTLHCNIFSCQPFWLEFF